MALEEKDVVLVTGASGFIGSAVVDRLATSFRVVGLDNKALPQPKTAAELITVDIASESSVEHALERVRHQVSERIAWVIHLAAFCDFRANQVRYLRRLMCAGLNGCFGI